MKRQRTVAEVPDRVRVRQILLRHWRGAGAEPQDPVRRRPVRRTPEEAELELLGVLEGLAGGGAGFSGACRAASECVSALKGGELSGDLGWLDRAKGVDAQRADGKAVNLAVPPAVRKAAFELEVGEIGDLVPSELGYHLLLRTA